ncbi:MAG TPA: OmpA family protein [Desulfomonilaceae bacterium]|nr:OmpA family protein [Desulfomonilaceae bacterium]
MSSRSVIHTAMLIVAVCVLIAGCSRPVVRSDGQQPGMPGFRGPHLGGQVSEREIEALQANLKPIYFDYDQFTLSLESQQTLQANAEILKRANVAVVAEGHCDERGTAEYNLALGDRRARSAVEYLAGAGVQPDRLSTVSYGSELPVDPSHNEAAWSKNRRVHLRVAR